MIEAQSRQAYQSTQRYLFTVAYRMTGSASDAEDLVHDAWLRYLAAGSPEVDSLRAYLTKVVSRLALDYLKSARVQREQYVGPWLPEPVLTGSSQPGPEESLEQQETITYAVLTLLERLKPEQRIVYVLREGCGLSYDEVARHVDKSAAACRQIYRRAQRLMKSAEGNPTALPPTPAHLRLAERFLTAFSTGNIEGIARTLAEDVVWMGDGGAARLTARRPIVGRDRVSRGIAGWAGKFNTDREDHTDWIEIAEINGAPALVQWSFPQTIERVMLLEIVNGLVTSVWVQVNPDKLRHLERTMLATRPVSVSIG